MDIKRLADAAKIPKYMRDTELTKFAELVAAVEREACAKLVAQMGGSDELACRLGRAMAQAIRERSNV